MGFSRKRKGSDEPESGTKRSKAAPSEPNIALTKPSEHTDDEGRPYWELSNKRRLGVTQFKGKPLVSLREYYEKDGKQLPAKQGISLTIEQYSVLVMALPAVEQALAAQGIAVPRPEYTEVEGGVEGVENDEEEEDDDEKGITTAKEVLKKSKGDAKKNYESTSDEDE